MTRLLLPPRLRKGGTIGLVAPSSPPYDPRRIAKGMSYLRRRGYNVIPGQSVHASEGYLAGSDELRAEDLNAMFADPAVDAIFCTRGGYGSGRLLDKLDYALIRKHSKILLGFSDCTALSLALLRKCGLLTFAGPMVAVELAARLKPVTEASFRDVLSSQKSKRVYNIASSNSDIRRSESRRSESRRSGICKAGIAEGQLIGGNLAVLVSLIGTPYMPDLRGAILFLEDIGENVYKIDRMLLQLKYAGILKQVAGVVLGSFTSIPEDEMNRDLTDVFSEYFLPLGVPVIDGFQFGHIPEKFTLPVGAHVRLNTGKRKLTVLQSVVAP